MEMLLVLFLLYMIALWIMGKDIANVLGIIALVVVLISNVYACVSPEDEKEEVKEISAYEQSLLDAEAEKYKTEEDFEGKLPYDGIYIENLKYTSLGAPDKTVEKTGYRTYYYYYWYTDSGELLAEAKSSKLISASKEIYAFEYYGDLYGYDANGFLLEPTPTPEVVELPYVESIYIVGSGELLVGTIEEYSVEILPEEHKAEEILWSSSDESKAVVSADGCVTALSEGVVTITATTEDTGVMATSEILIQQTIEPLTLATSYIGEKNILGSFYSINIQLEALATGGTGDYQYKFEVVQSGYVTRTVDWTTGNKIDIDFSGNGSCVVNIYLKDSNGEIVTETMDLLETASLASLSISERVVW